MRTAGLAPPDDGGKPKDHWWAHEENIVPLLTGLAAMGTAPTRHLGVALSAGLGAGAGSWLPAQQQEAEIQQQRAQAGITQTTLANYKGTGSSQMPTPQPVRPSGMAQGAPGDPQEVAFSKYAPVPTARPDSVAQRVTQLSFANPNAARAYGEQYDQGVKNELQRRQLTANSDYQGFVRVNGAAPGRLSPNSRGLILKRLQSCRTQTPSRQINRRVRKAGGNQRVDRRATARPDRRRCRPPYLAPDRAALSPRPDQR